MRYNNKVGECQVMIGGGNILRSWENFEVLMDVNCGNINYDSITSPIVKQAADRASQVAKEWTLMADDLCFKFLL